MAKEEKKPTVISIEVEKGHDSGLFGFFGLGDYHQATIITTEGTFKGPKTTLGEAEAKIQAAERWL